MNRPSIAPPNQEFDLEVTPGSFTAVRRDGRLVPETMMVDDMLEDGLEPDNIVALHWDYAGRPISLRTSFNFTAEIVPSRTYIAVVEALDETDEQSSLSIYRADGELMCTFASLADIDGSLGPGEFLWFEEPRSSLLTAVSLVVRSARNGATWQVDLNTPAGTVLGVNEAR